LGQFSDQADFRFKSARRRIPLLRITSHYTPTAKRVWSDRCYKLP